MESLKGALVASLYDQTPLTMVPAALAHGKVRCLMDRVEVSAAAAAGSTYDLGRLPSNARIIPGTAKIYWDDLASSGSPTGNLGLAPVRDGDFTEDADAFKSSLDLATANTAGIDMIDPEDITKFGLPIWDLVNGLTEDPGVDMVLRLTTVAAACNDGGTLSVVALYTVE